MYIVVKVTVIVIVVVYEQVIVVVVVYEPYSHGPSYTSYKY